jgi:hypothetical protein
MNYEEEKVNLESIANYLDKMGIPFVFQDIGEKENEKFPGIACTYRYNNSDFDVIVFSVGNWIHVKALVLDTKEYPSELVRQLYEIALNLNYELPETTFSAFNQKVYIEIDCLVNVAFDDFEGEFKSIAEGLNNYLERIEKIEGIKIYSTKGKTSADIRGKE